MKNVLLTLLLLLVSHLGFAQTFTIDINGIVKCPNARPGDKETLFGVTYEAVDNNLLIQRRDQGADLTKVCTSLVTDMSNVYYESRFNQPIVNSDVSSVTDMNVMFDKTSFNQPIGNWDVSSVVDMSGMFSGSQFNQPIGNWDVSSVGRMDNMFRDSQFNQPVNFWCVTKINTEPILFSGNSPLTLKNKPVWGTCPSLIPPKTLQLLPSNNSTNVPRKVFFSWKRDSLSTEYQIQVFEGVVSVLDVLVSDTTLVIPSNLKGNTEYTWKVRGYLKPRKVYSEWSSVWKFTTQMGTSLKSDEQPIQYSLAQNFPNPFNPSTQIQFSIPSISPVKIEVYNSVGQRVKILVDDIMSSGTHSITFDASSLSSGVYLYRLTTPEFTQTKVMSLVK